jgi:hypothetical protein
MNGLGEAGRQRQLGSHTGAFDQARARRSASWSYSFRRRINAVLRQPRQQFS